MKKLIFGCLLVLVLLLVISYQLSVPSSFAATCDVADCSSPDDCQNKIAECQQLLSAYTPSQSKNKEQLAALEKQLRNTENLIKSAETQIKKVEKEIFDREVKLAYQQEVFNAKVRNFYIRSQRLSPFLLFLASENAASLTRELSYRLATAQEDKRMIVSITQDLAKLKTDKEKLDANKIWLAKIKQAVGQQAAFLRKEVEKVDSFLGTISGKIASLTAKQQSLLAEKAGTFQTTVGEVPLADDPASRPDFDPGFRPAFAAFSFGAPHRKGMSQYGAFGRAKDGQNVEQILRAYYGGGIEIKKDYSTSININVRGYGTVDIETYVKRIYEVPNNWGDNGGMEALKAQAVAARSYALAYTGNGAGSICATEACQVYKPADKGGTWNTAAEATRGWVLMANGQPLSAWYAASSGGYNFAYTGNGYTTAGGWDTKCGNQSCWTNDAYEKMAASPWFYKAWYKARSGASCSRSHPWLNQEEMADILNSVIVYRNGGEAAAHILPIDYNACFGAGGDPWNKERIKQEAGGSAVTGITGVSVSYGTDGVTAKLIFNTNNGAFEVTGDQFYTVFNLRAPGRISLKSKLFNLETK